METTTSTAPHPRRFNVDEYHRLAYAGILKPDEHIELLDGKMYLKYLGEERRFNVFEYYEMARAGILKPHERLELIDGEVIVMSPIGSRHAACVDRANERFILAMHGRAVVRVQSPIRLADGVEPEPDLALLRPRQGYDEAHPGPGDVLLIVEVADTSLSFDRQRKLPLYARHGIPEVWIVALGEEAVEVYRKPGGDRYEETTRHARGQTLSVQTLPRVRFSVDAFLGPA